MKYFPLFKSILLYFLPVPNPFILFYFYETADSACSHERLEELLHAFQSRGGGRGGGGGGGGGGGRGRGSGGGEGFGRKKRWKRVVREGVWEEEGEGGKEGVWEKEEVGEGG